MLKRMSRLLARVRGAQAHPAPSKAPPVTWRDDLADAGLTADAWIAERLMAGRLFVGLPEAGVERLRAREPELVQSTIKAADRVLQHEFDLLGSGPYTPVDPDRAADPRGTSRLTGISIRSPASDFPRGIPHTEWHLDSMRPGLADIKLPWELGRCQHWPVLGEAYRLTGDDRYAIEIARELRDFMEANPVGTGVNWTCTMDVAIRAANWALGLELVRSCPAWLSGSGTRPTRRCSTTACSSSATSRTRSR